MSAITVTLTGICSGGAHLTFTVSGDRSGTVPAELREMLQPITEEEAQAFVKVVTKMARAGRTNAQARTLLQNGVTMAQGGRVGFASGLDRRTPNHPTFQALQFYTDFARPTKDVYSWDEEMASAFDSFVSGKSAFYFGFAFDRARIRSRAPRLSLEVIPVLQLNESAPVNVANYWIESVPARSKHPNEAWDFVRFMTTATNVKRYTEATGQPSPLRSHLAEQTQDSAVAAFAAQALTATNWYHGRNIESANHAFSDLLHALLQPYGPREEPAERDAALVQRAAQVVQQTL